MRNLETLRTKASINHRGHHVVYSRINHFSFNRLFLYLSSASSHPQCSDMDTKHFTKWISSTPKIKFKREMKIISQLYNASFAVLVSLWSPLSSNTFHEPDTYPRHTSCARLTERPLHLANLGIVSSGGKSWLLTNSLTDMILVSSECNTLPFGSWCWRTSLRFLQTMEANVWWCVSMCECWVWEGRWITFTM